MKHKQAGIEKRVSENVFPKDILSDARLRMCSLLTRGAWYECLWNMWYEKTDSVSGDYAALGRLWGCEVRDVKKIVTELSRQEPCTLLVVNGMVTLTCRRLKRRRNARKKDNKRLIEWRKTHPKANVKRKRNSTRNGDETSKNANPSLPLPLPLPPPGGNKPPMFLSELKTKQEAKRGILADLTAKHSFQYAQAQKDYPNEWEAVKKLKAEIKAINRQIANYGDE